MKQRITTAQLQELTPSQQDKLREWWQPQYNDVFIFSNSRLIKCVDSIEDLKTAISKKDILPLLSIGQMLQLIDESGKYIRYQFIVGRSHNAKSPDEFCDELWETVKEVLSGEA